MRKLTIKKSAAVLLLIILFCACGKSDVKNDNESVGASIARPLAVDNLPQDNITQDTHAQQTESPQAEPKHAIRNIGHEVFNQSINHPRPLAIDGFVTAGIVPHHSTAATLISGFFAGVAASADYHDKHYDLVIILAPNHSGDLADVALSYRDWDIGDGVFTDKDFVNSLTEAGHINTAISHEHLETDHSASILIPYIYHYLPSAKVAPMLLSRSLGLGATLNLFDWLMNWINKSGQNVLLVASIDFSHFLTPAESAQKNVITANAIMNRDYRFIHSLSDHYLDSPASMIIFLKYLEELGQTPQIILSTEASEFLGPGLSETTSYKIVVNSTKSAY